MFTGIIAEVSKVVATRAPRGNFLVQVVKPARWSMQAGESISVNGICSTVVSVHRGVMQFEYMPETLRKTTAAAWRAGEMVNLERSLKVGDALDGHLVTGHVDGVGRIVAARRHRGARLLTIQLPPALSSLIVPKGSVAIDGVSLTVVSVGKNGFTVALTSYTLAHTNLQFLAVGDRINIEADILAKYFARIARLRKHAYPPAGGLLCSSRRTAQGFRKRLSSLCWKE